MQRKQNGQFTSQGLRGNSFAKGNRPNKTTFKKGVNHTGTTHPSWRGGVQVMRKDCVYVYTDTNTRVRRPKLVWESVYGPLPKGYVLIHIDGDRYNDDINNLEAITRAELVARNNKRI